MFLLLSSFLLSLLLLVLSSFLLEMFWGVLQIQQSFSFVGYFVIACVSDGV